MHSHAAPELSCTGLAAGAAAADACTSALSGASSGCTHTCILLAHGDSGHAGRKDVDAAAQHVRQRAQFCLEREKEKNKLKGKEKRKELAGKGKRRNRYRQAMASGFRPQPGATCCKDQAAVQARTEA